MDSREESIKFIVDRKTWYRGRPAGSKLLRKDGQRCCIGFVASQCGVPDEEMLDIGAICSTKDWCLGKFPYWMRYGNIDCAYEVNDDSLYSDEQRERRLQEIFDSHGDEIEFVG